MSKKGSKESKQFHNLNKFIVKNNKAEEKTSVSATHKNEGKKKICTSLNEFLNNKEKPALVPQTNRKFSLQHLLKQTQIQSLFQKCPKLKQLLHFICEKTGLNEKLVIHLMMKYLQTSQHCLWSRRYSPREISELFNVQAGKKIKKWISAFFQYRNKIIEEDSFLNDQSSEKECDLYKNVRQNQWQLLALIVRGRPGIGKTSAIRAVAHEMDIDLQECGNEYNQAKYLKEKNESTQSESVKTAYIKKAKIEKNAQMITKFMTPVEKQKPKENKKSQMIHNVSMVYPESQAPKFYQQLSRCVELSKIPFILTNSGEKLPKQCEKYDIIQFGSGSNELIIKTFWAICHIEELLSLNKQMEIQKEQIFQSINSQIEEIQFHELCPLSMIKDICELYNYRLDYIFTFLEHHRKTLNQIDIFPLFLDKLKHMNEDQLLEEILFIDFNRLKVNSQPSTPDKSQDHNITQESSDFEKGKQQGSTNMTRYSKVFKLAALQDTLENMDGYDHFNNQSFHLEDWNEHPQTCIDVKIHKGIKESLVKMTNSEINFSSEKMRSSLEVSELSYLPMLIREKRANRNSRISIDALKKIFDPNELCYLQNFGHLLRQQK